MADKWPLANGNWSNAANWNDGTKPVAGDNVYADGKTITIDENVNIGSGNISNSQRSGGTLGGSFALANNITITAGVIQMNTSGTYIFSGGSNCTINCTSISGWTNAAGPTINGNVVGASGSSSRYGLNSPTGTLVVNGNVTGGTGVENVGILLSSSATLTVNGNVSGGNTVGVSPTSGIYQPFGIMVSSGGPTIVINGHVNSGGGNVVCGVRINTATAMSFTVNGNVTAGSLHADNHGIWVNASNAVCNLTVTGDVTAGLGNGVAFYGTGTCIIQGNATAGASGYGASNNTIGGTLRVYGCAIGNNFGLGGDSAGYAGVYGTGTSTGGVDTTTTVRAMKSGAKGQAAIAGRVFLDTTDLANSFAKFRTAPSSFTEYTFGPAENIGGQPATSDVRSGVVYNFGTRTGTCAVPAASSVAAGVPVDNTTGTAILTGSTLRSALGMASANMDAQFAAIAVDLTPVLNRLPTALEGGRMAAALSSTVLTQLFADADVTDLVNQIAAKFDAVDDLPIATIAGAVRDVILNRVLVGNHDTPGTPGKILQDTLTQASASASSAASAASSAATAATQSTSAASSAATAATQSTSANTNAAAAKAAAESADGKLSVGRLALIDGAAQKGTGTNTLASIADLINNLETGGLTPEEGAQLNRIEAAAAQINGARLETSGAVTPGGSVQLIVGKDYVTAAQNGLNRTVSDPGGILAAQLQSATQAAVKRFGAQRPSGGPQIVGTIGSVTYANGVTTIPIEISRDAIPDTLKPGDDYRYMIERQTSDGKLVVCVSGDLSLERRTV